MDEEILYVREVGKRKNKRKVKQAFPVIKRTDIMEAILSPELDKTSLSKLSNLYAEITYIEKLDLKYMSEIVVASKDDFEIYEILKNYKRKKCN
mgnify:CR=1 FL=1